MTFPGRGCSNCRQRHIKCDEAKPVCDRCQKAKLSCDGSRSRFLFLDENEYAIGQKKRPRGPNVRKSTSTRVESHAQNPLGSSMSTAESSGMARTALMIVHKPTRLSMLPALNIPIEDQALAYISRYHEGPPDHPEMMRSHLQFEIVEGTRPPSGSLHALSTSAIALASFSRARHNRDAMVQSTEKYSKALEKTNLALKDLVEAKRDDVLLSVMRLSFYENVVLDESAPGSSNDVRSFASRAFTHHDGASAILKLRRQANTHSERSMELDKLVRRQLLRSLLLRSLTVPAWLQDGAQFGERGIALELDRCICTLANLRYNAAGLHRNTTSSLQYDTHGTAAAHRLLLSEAEALDDTLSLWAANLPMQTWYSTHTVQDDGRQLTKDLIFDNKSVHLYPTVGHAGMWNRYRAVRLGANDFMLQCLRALALRPDPGVAAIEEAALLRAERILDEICGSVPYTFGLIGSRPTLHQEPLTATAPASLKESVTVNTAALLCWPLAFIATMASIPIRYRGYLKDRLLDCSFIMHDGVLATIARSSRTFANTAT